MDFSSVDVRAMLKASMPVRFADISPFDFEDFVAELFRKDGYQVEQTPYSGDFGADLVVRKDGGLTVVQVKRYGQETPVGVSDINQVIGAQSYYEASGALVITTSQFTQGAIQLARQASVHLWDWARLERYICQIFLDGEDYYAFYRDETGTEQLAEPRFALHFQRLELDETYEGRPAITTHIGLENRTGENAYIHLELPLVVNKAQRQVRAIAWRPDFFHEGLLVAGATAEVACFFAREQLEAVKPGDRMVLRIHVRGYPQPVLIDQKMGVPGSGCYVVTLCFGRSTEACRRMTAWRDTLVRHRPGRWLVNTYYRVSPGVVRYVLDRRPGAGWLAFGLQVGVRTVLWFLRFQDKKPLRHPMRP